MSIALKEQDLEVLHHKFGVPKLVQKWLSETKKTSSHHELSLHEDICNMHPEDALLCIALCLRIIEQEHDQLSSLLHSLHPLIENIIKNYGEPALERMNMDLHNSDRTDIEFVAADLQDLARAMEDIEAYIFEISDPILPDLLSALSIQTGAQAEVALYVCKNFQEQEKKHTEFKADDTIPFLKTLPVNDNRVKS